MSNKKNPKRNPQTKNAANAKPVKPEKAESSGKKSTKIIIAAAIAIVVIAAVLVGVFVVKPAIDEKKEVTTSDIGTTQPPKEGEKYTYVNYKGARMATEIAEMLNQAEADNRASINKDGAVLTIGDREISKSKFVLYYLDQYRLQRYKVQYATQETGYNATGYDLSVLPDEQQHVDGQYTWAESFTRDVEENLKVAYETFDAALKDGFELEEHEIYDLIQTYSRVVDYLSDEYSTEDEYVESVYGKGTTYAIFAEKEIVAYYAAKYEASKIAELSEDCTEEEIKKEITENKKEYMVVKARVYPIQAEYTESEIANIGSEKDFLDFAEKNCPQEGYNADIKTQMFYVDRASIESTFGAEVAEWVFSEERVAGDVGFVQSSLYEYVVYVETLPFFDTSRDIILYEEYFDGSESDAVIEERYNEVKALYDSWSSQNMTADEFRAAVSETDHANEATVRTGDYYFQINNWVLDSSRKSGDMEFFADTSGLYIVYFCEKNEDDFDWQANIRTNMGTIKYLTEREEVINKEYPVERDEKVLELAYKTANVRITYNINREKGNS